MVKAGDRTPNIHILLKAIALDGDRVKAGDRTWW